MRSFLRATVVLVVLGAAGLAWSKAGPPIPVPDVKAAEAIELANKHFLEKETRAVDTEVFDKSDYILVLARYTNLFDGKRGKTWAWQIRFVHPVQNDHAVEYKVTGDRKVIFLSASE